MTLQEILSGESNAIIHRSYLDHNNIQVAVYDDRLEVTSPGKLPVGQSIERMKEGYSKIRNEAIAHAFSYMKLMEHWGSGIPRIIECVIEAGLKEPEFVDGDVDLRINIYRGQLGDMSDTGAHGDAHDSLIGRNVVRKRNLSEIIIEEIRKNSKVTREQIAVAAGVSKKTIERELKKMDNVRYCGSGRNGHREID